MRTILTSLVLATSIALGGCATFGGKVGNAIDNIVNVATGVTVSPKAVVIAGYSVDTLQDTATAYLRLPRCRAGGTPICRVREATQPIRRAVLAMRAARNEFEDFYAAHPNSGPPASLYEKVTAAALALSNVIERFNARPVVAAIAR